MNDYSAESALVAELRALGRVPAEQDAFAIEWEGLRVSAQCSGGSSSSVTLSVPYDAAARSVGAYRDGTKPISAIRPMNVHVDPENAVHGVHKASGMNVEHQTGDEPFDDAVYIGAPTAEPLPALFAPEGVRASILELFALEFRSVVIDNTDGQITTYTSSFPDLRPRTGTPGRDAIAAFVRLAKSLPPVRATGEDHPTDPLERPATLAFGMAGILFLSGAPIYFIFAGSRCPSEETSDFGLLLQCVWPGVTGLVVGILAGLTAITIAHSTLKARYAGGSDSSTRVRSLSAGIGFLVFNVVALALSLAIAWLT